MLIKEYRIPLPLTVDEYRIAQLYMIAKKSREESHGEGSGVEILVNEPYEDGPGGKGQYTRKIYHVGSHLPGWFKSLLPKSALTVEEEAWNAYPYTRTRYTCPFVEKFSLDIETYYFPDNGHQDNVFNLSGDVIDVVKDQLYSTDYLKEEDPKLYISSKTSRGPLSDNWLEEYWNDVKGKSQPTPSGKSLMCAYKLCKVEFKYWGMQSKIEKFIHDSALRRTMLRAHRQAWAWQDEWHGLTMEDIRQIERQTQEALKKTMGGGGSISDEEEDDEDEDKGAESPSSPDKGFSNGPLASAGPLSAIEKPEQHRSPPTICTSADSGGEEEEDEKTVGDSVSEELVSRRRLWSRSNSKATLHSPGSGSGKSFDIQMANWRMESIVRDSDSASEDEFFDCQEELGDSATSLVKWSSMELIGDDADLDSASPSALNEKQDSIFSHSFLSRVVSERGRPLRATMSVDQSLPASPTMSPAHHPCSTTVLLLVLHAGSVLDANVDLTAKKSDITTFRGAFESVMRQHYPSMVGRIAIKLVSCPSVCSEGLGILSSLNPYSFDVSPSCTDTPHITHDSIPIGAIPMFATSTPEYRDAITRVISSVNSAYQEFIRSDEGHGFNGQVCLVGDSMGSIMAYDALCRSGQYQNRHDSDSSLLEPNNDGAMGEWGESESQHHQRHLSAPAPRRRSSSTSDHQSKLEFEVNDLFMFGSPLALVLAYRKVASTDDKSAPIPRPQVQQVYNLFHPTDPVAARIEPLISARFSMLPPVNIARYQKYPLGNGNPYHLLEFIQANPQLFTDTVATSPGCHLRRMSEISMQSIMSGINDTLPMHTITSLSQKWWGPKRLDYALYCPEGLANFPTNALPHLFHASYWESSDVIAFMVRQLGRLDPSAVLGRDDKEMASFNPGQPREKWLRKRTSVKLKNVAANHRANDVIVKEGAQQVLTSRFMYGPLDMITLA
ncbi:hypothetical protein B566_EDAN004570, partial [Ephemera danica]